MIIFSDSVGKGIVKQIAESCIFFCICFCLVIVVLQFPLFMQRSEHNSGGGGCGSLPFGSG
jgi:hypothetical protein